MGSSRNGTCGRRMWVIHTLGVSSTLIHRNAIRHIARHYATQHGAAQDITQRSTAQRKTLRNAARRSARHYATQHGAAQQKRKTRRSGPSCKNLRSRIAAQQHRRNGKSIQCPFNVTTYLGHTHLVGLCSSVVLVLRNYARHCGKCKPKRDDVPYLSQLLLSDRKNRKNAPCCANRNACLFIHVHLPRKNGVSEAYFTNSANEC